MIREALPPLLEKVSAWHPDLVLLATTAPGRIGGLGLDHEVARSIDRATGAEVLTGTDALVMALDVLGPTQIAVFVHSSRVRAAQTASLVTETGYHAAWVRSVGIGGDEPALSVEPEAMTDGIAMAMNGVNVDCVLLESTDWIASGSTTSLGAVLGLPVLTTVGCLMDLMDAWVELASP